MSETTREVEKMIERAEQHSLGDINFLKGFLERVAKRRDTPWKVIIEMAKAVVAYRIQEEREEAERN